MGHPDQGRPQGAVRSPRLANGYVPAGRDTWSTTGVKTHGRGQGVLSRSADDVLSGGAWADDARRLTAVRPTRGAK